MNTKLIFFILWLTGFSNVHSQVQPNNIPGLVLWLKADDGVNLSGNEVTTWQDQSVSGNDFSPANIGLRPKLVTNSIYNGKPYVNFDGTDNLSSQNLVSLGNTTMFIVAAQNANENDYSRIIDHGYNTGFWLGRVGNTVGGGFYETGAPFGNFKSATNAIPFILTLSRSAATTSYFYNSVPFTTATRTTSAATTVSNKIYLGSTIIADNFGKKNIFEIIIYQGNLSIQDRTQIETYLKNRYVAPLSAGLNVNATNFCAVNLNASTGFSNYTWSTGQTGQAISVSQSGNYVVSASDVFGYIHTDTVQVSFPNIPLPTNTQICGGQNSVWNASMGPGFSYLWPNGSTGSSLSIGTSGNYQVVVTGPGGCSANSGTVNFTVDPYPFAMSLGADTSLCSGNIIGVQVGAQQTVSYLWQDGSTQPTLSVTSSGSYSVSTTNSNGCVAQDTISVTVAGIAPILNYTVPNSGCSLSAFNFQDNSTVLAPNLITSIDWTFSNGSQVMGSTGQITPSTSGWIIGSLEVTSTGNCAASDTFSIYIHTPPQYNIQFTGGCDNENIAFSAQNATNSGMSSALWNFGQSASPNNTSSQIQSYHDYGSPGPYNIQLIGLDVNGCSDTAMMSINVKASPTAQISISNACENTLLNFISTSTSNDTSALVSYIWDFGDGSNSNLSNPIHTFSGSGNYNCLMMVTAGNGCSDSVVQNLSIYPMPDISWNLSPSCKNSITTFESTSSMVTGSIQETNWMVNLQYPIQGSSGSYTFLTYGLQYLELNVLSDLGCSKDTLILVDVKPELNSNFIFNPSVLIAGLPAVFEDNSTGGNGQNWIINGVNLGSNSSISYHIDDTLVGDSLSVLHITTNGNGCVDSTQKLIPIVGPFNDLAVNKIFLSEIGNLSSVGLEIQNLGALTIDSFTLNLSLSNQVLFENLWTGELKPDQTINYLFPSSPALSTLDQNELSDWICAKAFLLGPEYPEINLNNNTQCLTLEGQAWEVSNPLPNPTENGFEFSMIFGEDTQITADLFDSQGKHIKSIFNESNFLAGTYGISVDLTNQAHGLYLLKVSSQTKTKSIRISKI